MAYECQNFKNGQVLSADCLNRMEQGIKDACSGVKTVNGMAPDKNGNVEVESSGNVDLAGYATEQWVQDGYQPKGSYLTEVPDGYATEEYVRNKIAEAELSGEDVDLSGYAQKSELPTKVSQLQNDAGYAKTEDIPTEPADIGAQPEGDYALRSEIPAVPVKSVNGKTGAVSLGASDVGALPNTTKIPSKTSDLENDSGFITGYTETDPTVPSWAKAASKPSYSKSEVGLGNVDNVKQYSASNPPPYPVTSVNGKTGAVSLDAAAVGARPSTWMPSASDVGALPSTTKIPAKTSELTNDSGFITGYTETDPTVPAWAKASSKPSYSKSEVGLGNVDNVKQYSASNPPPYPVTSVNGKTGAVTIDIPTVPTKVSAFTNDSGYLDKTDKAEIEAYIATELAKPVQIIPEMAESVEWLNENGDTSKVYVLVDKNDPGYGYVYEHKLTEKEVETGGGYTNALDGTTKNINQRWSHSGKKLSSATGYMTTEKLPVTADKTVYVNLPRAAFLGNYARIHYFDASGNYVSAHDGTAAQAFILTTDADDVTSWKVGYENATYNDASTNGRMTRADNITHMVIVFNMSSVVHNKGDTAITDADVASVIVSVGNPIEEGGTEIVKEWAWANTGLPFVSAGNETVKTPIKNWDAPIYDANIPVFQLSAEKAAMTNATNTPANIYAKYDALMAKHPKYITKTDLGLCSDGVNHVYRYDFREPDPHYESGKVWSETKAKAIIVTGIHYEWAGIYAMYNALEEIADNPELRNFRRNTHLIVVPCANPYATIANNYQSGLSTPNSYGVRNANGVEIHRNFEVDWVLTEAGSTHYGGSAPLSEVETQYIDNIMRSNTDSALFLSCHNCGVDTFWGTGFIWASTATKYMTNMGFRLVDKLSDAWMDKYGVTLSAGIAEYKTDLLEDGDTRLGWAGLSSSPGTEAKQATKYGIQGTNVEICDPFQIHGTKASPEPSMSAFTMSRGAEVYVNFLLTAFGVYDPKDKALYG